MKGFRNDDKVNPDGHVLRLNSLMPFSQGLIRPPLVRLIENYKNVDLKIAFYSGNHGDGDPFEGPGGILAHPFAPTDGRLHFDADERWSNDVVPGSFNLESMALHEIGYLLGHSSINANHSTRCEQKTWLQMVLKDSRIYILEE
ncbi:unnamed protein product [Ilex paraguariensis]|uniref:Peptidase M10 metallopeptidase domain-containing protein n=1 Tax=Ilex paraguariensis TaxID=185542 RepID=A0ABC8SSA0_9AQUA